MSSWGGVQLTLPRPERTAILGTRFGTLLVGTITTLAGGSEGDGLIPLALVMAIAVAASVGSALPLRPALVPVLEGVAASAVIVAWFPSTAGLLPYLIAPALAAGVRSGVQYAVITSGLSVLTLLAGLLPWDLETLTLVTEWGLVAVGAGLLGAWVHRVRRYGTDEKDAYREVGRLLGEVRSLIRPLAGGLDPKPLAEQMLTELARELPQAGTALFLGSAGAMRLVGARGPVPPPGWDLPALAEVREQVLASQVPERVTVADKVAVGVPAAGQDRVFGVLMVCTTPRSVDRAVRYGAQVLSVWAYQLSAAALFDEVQMLATRAERSRLARDMHDGVAQDVASLGYLLDDIAIDADDETAKRIEALREELSRVVTDLRLSIHDLREEGLRTGGLAGAIGEVARREAQNGGLAVHLRLHETHNILTADVENELYRIAHEAIVNARRHAQASNLWVSCSVGPGGVVLQIDDDGVGLGQGRPDSYGLATMQERATKIGAELVIAPRSPHGTSVRVVLSRVAQEVGASWSR